MELIEAIKECKEIFLEVVMPSTCFFAKVSKKDLLAQILNNADFNGAELHIITKFGKDALYLTTHKKLS